MPTEISSKDARSLCTASEHELVRFSRQRDLRKIKPTEVRARISRTRRLRDKFRDLVRRQRLEMRGKKLRATTTDRRLTGNDRTVKKVALFEQTLVRLEAMLERILAPAKTPRESSRTKPRAKGSTESRNSKRGVNKQAAKSPKATPSLLGVAGLSGGKVSSSLRNAMVSPSAQIAARQTRRMAISKSSELGRARSHWSRTARATIRGHISASGRKAQARRDSRAAV